MKIRDVTSETVARKKRIGEVEKLVKEVFDDCATSLHEDLGISINKKSSGSQVALINLLIDSGFMTLKDDSYEQKAIQFGEEYETRKLNAPFVQNDSLFLSFVSYLGRNRHFTLEKNYS